jgi:hypothetical protein
MSGLINLSSLERGVLRVLISLAYDKEQMMSWRAIEAIGRIAGEIAKSDPSRIRNLVGRLLWTIREESGGIGWSAPEILGEIVRNCPDDFPDIARIIASFYEEDMLKAGVLNALVRISENRPDLVGYASGLIAHSLQSGDPHIKAYAVILAGRLKSKEYISEISGLVEDGSLIKIYSEGDFKTRTIGEIAEETVILLRS